LSALAIASPPRARISAATPSARGRAPPPPLVDDDLGSFLGEQECVFPPDAATGTGDDRNSSVE